MDRMDDLTAFLTIVEKGSQTAAARHLRRSLQSINRSLTTLECSVGVELISRNHAPIEPDRSRACLLPPHQARSHGDQRCQAGGCQQARRTLRPVAYRRCPGPVRSGLCGPVVCDFLKAQSEDRDRAEGLRPAGGFPGAGTRPGCAHPGNARLQVQSPAHRRVARGGCSGAPAYFSKHGRPRHPDEFCTASLRRSHHR